MARWCRKCIYIKVSEMREGGRREEGAHACLERERGESAHPAACVSVCECTPSLFDLTVHIHPLILSPVPRAPPLFLPLLPQPKLVTLMASKFPAVPLAFIDVNAVPSAVVSGAGVTKMPTIVVFVRGEIAGTYVAGESAPTAVLAVEAMVDKAVKAAAKI